MFRRFKHFFAALFCVIIFAHTGSVKAQVSPISGMVPTAAPSLTGPLIRTLNTDRSHYTNGESVTLFVGLNNTSGGAYSGTLSVKVYGRGILVSATPIVTSVSSLAVNGFATYSLQIPTTDMVDHQGYLVTVDALDGSGNRVDSQNTSIDFSYDWKTYPRQCWFTGTFLPNSAWGTNVTSLYKDPYTDVSALNAMHCNNLQFYNNLYRWHMAYGPTETYTNGDGILQSKALIRKGVMAAKSFGMGTFFYIPLYAARVTPGSDFTHDGSGAQLNWAMFDSNCAPNCTVSNVWKFNQDIGYMNPNNLDWQTYWAQQLNKVINDYGFDGPFVDTYGTINTPLWDFLGVRVIMDKAYSSFLKTVSSLVNGAFILNPAGSYLEQDLVSSGIEAYHFVERWNNSSDMNTFQSFFDKAFQVWGWAKSSGRANAIGLDWDLGMNKTLATSSACSINGGSKNCVFNLPGVLYQEASILASGAHHAWIVGGSQGSGQNIRLISNDDYPIGNMLSVSPALLQALFDYQTFGVAYEKLLRLNISKSTAAAASVTTSSLTGSTTATAGTVWLSQSMRSGFDVLSLINLTTISDTSLHDVNDNAGNATAASTLSGVQIKMYYTGDGSALGNLYIASPDANHGNPLQLSYTKGSDSNGGFITFTAPSLNVWDLVWLENGLTVSDYATP